MSKTTKTITVKRIYKNCTCGFFNFSNAKKCHMAVKGNLV